MFLGWRSERQICLFSLDSDLSDQMDADTQGQSSAAVTHPKPLNSFPSLPHITEYTDLLKVKLLGLSLMENLRQNTGLAVFLAYLMP